HPSGSYHLCHKRQRLSGRLSPREWLRRPCPQAMRLCVKPENGRGRMSNPIIVFDLDGTLVNTAPDLLDSLNHCLDAGGMAVADASSIHQVVGGGGRVMIERAYAAQQKPLATDEHDRLYALFLEHYGINIPGKSLPYPGVLDTLGRFAAAGYDLAICTNKPET